MFYEFLFTLNLIPRLLNCGAILVKRSKLLDSPRSVLFLRSKVGLPLMSDTASVAV